MSEHFDLLMRQPVVLTEDILNLVRADLSGEPRTRESALSSLGETIAQGMTVADLHGRMRTMKEADALERRYPPPVGPEPMLFAAQTDNPAVAHVPFTEAVDDILRREPRLAGSYEEISSLYQKQHVVAAVRAADMYTAQTLRDTLARFEDQGVAEAQAKQVLASMFDWAESYAQTVYRTNMATAWSAGRFKAASHPDVARVIGAFEYVAVGDRDTRKNHLAAKGLLASQFDDIWHTFSPPLGYNCRCGLRMVSRFTLQRRGLLEGNQVVTWKPPSFHAAHPDPGFGGRRPDRVLYG